MQEILETLVLHDYETIFAIDTETQRYSKCYARHGAVMTVPEAGSFSEASRDFARHWVVEEDRAVYLDETDWLRLLEQTARQGKHVIRYRIKDREGNTRYRRQTYVRTDDDTGLIGAVYDETEEVLEQFARARDLRLKNEGIRFIVRHMCENFLIVDPETGESMIFVQDSGLMQKQKTYREQLEWFAEHIVAPEERETYLRCFELETLISRIRDSGGICTVPCTVVYPDGRHDFIITGTLITDPAARKDRFYVLTSAQDVTQLKQALKTRRKLLKQYGRDALTGLTNRDAAEKRIHAGLGQRTDGKKNAFVLMDLDDFKSVNDCYGHATGDAVLKFMGEAMRRTFRATDVACRWGGDEFALFIAGVTDKKRLCQRLSALQERMKTFQRDGRKSLPVTLSIGGVIAPDTTSFDRLYRLADEALYTVKTGRKNDVVLTVV